MSLRLKKIQLNNFRNYSNFSYSDLEDLNILIGLNGVGKTNIIEAIQLITSLESFRKPKWDEVIKWEKSYASVIGNIVGDNRDLEISMSVENNRRRYYLNNKSKNRADILGLLPAVLFNPDDLSLVKGASEIRRDALDQIGGQISSVYYDLKNKYLKATKQKNNILQSFRQGNSLDIKNKDFYFLIDSWNENISSIGANFIKHRLNLFSIFRNNLIEVGLDLLKQNKIDIVYIPSWSKIDGDKEELRENIYSVDEIKKKFLERLEFLKEAELANGKTLIGPHRDDIKFCWDKKDARKFASQGQQRFIALCFKIAEMMTLEKITGQIPILLLDDVMSELDKQKREILINYLNGRVQTFITSVDVEFLDKNILKEALILDIGKMF